VCDTTAFILRNGVEEELLVSVDLVTCDGDDVAIRNIFGEERNLKARLKLLDTRENRILFELL